MVHPGDAAHGAEEVGPLGAKRRQHLSAPRQQFVAAATPAGVAGFPVATHPTAIFHAIEKRIERGESEAESTARIVLDMAGDFVAMEGLPFEDAEDGEFGGAAFEFGADHREPSYM